MLYMDYRLEVSQAATQEPMIHSVVVNSNEISYFQTIHWDSVTISLHARLMDTILPSELSGHIQVAWFYDTTS